MADIILLAGSPRNLAGKGPARAARRAGAVPGVIYGNKLDPVTLSVERKALEQLLLIPGFFTRLLDVTIDGENHRVLPRDIQFHPVTDVPLHVDFLRFSADRRVTVSVPALFLNEEDSPGLKRGGVLNIVRHELEVSCTADHIPEVFEISLEGFDIGDSIHASVVKLPEGVEFVISDRDFTIATIAAPTVVTDEAAEAAAAEAGEGEEVAEGEGATEGEGDADADTKE
ncbi:MAG: 50S ribosomal protein L25/general stress protein Ctc [Rhodospirillales bacterium]|nr:50S ribosomal protein L25/general stress protein Ctc [Rhodospirillales bacterium]